MTYCHRLEINMLVIEAMLLENKCINGGENTSAGISDEGTCPLPLEGTTKADVTRMVEGTEMVYKFMEEQHKLDSSIPKQPLILQDVERLNEYSYS
jgi:hypothetical protein